MKNSVLNFGAMMLMLLFVFACNKEKEAVVDSNEQATLKATSYKKNKVATPNEPNISQLLVDQYRYIHDKVDHDFKYYKVLPERRDKYWFNKNFGRLFKKNTSLNKWVLQNVASNQILLFGSTVNKTKVVTLIFPKGLKLPKEFENKRGIMLDTNYGEDCVDWCEYGQVFNDDGSCACYANLCCPSNISYCIGCPQSSSRPQFRDIIAPEIWVHNFEYQAKKSVQTIKMGEPVLPY